MVMAPANWLQGYIIHVIDYRTIWNWGRGVILIIINHYLSIFQDGG